ncbi:MAG TPA: hypothetical protein VF988_06005 [Verrucomicrobiae bacterium]
MNIAPSPSPSARQRAAFSLAELLVASAVGIIVVGMIASLAIFSANNLLAVSNYTAMDDQSRNALDKISREIRNATALVDFSNNSPQFLLLTNAQAGTSCKITYDSGAGTLALQSGQTNSTLLTGCDSFSFELFDRYPLVTSTNLSFYYSTNFTTGNLDAKFCKVINMSWKCSRTVLGSKMNTEIVQTAQVVLRNKVQ